MKEFVTYLIKNLVDQPDAVDVRVIDGEQGSVIEVRVAPEDVAKVVGRQGRTVKALRTIAMIIGARFGRRVRLEVMQPEGHIKTPIEETVPAIEELPPEGGRFSGQ